MENNYEVKTTEIVKFQIHRNVINLYKDMLIMLEDIVRDHDEAMDKLHKALPPEYKNYVDLADYLTEDKFNTWRSKILSQGNNCIRNLEQVIENLDINIKKGK